MKMSERFIAVRALAALGALLLSCMPIAQRAWADSNTDNPSVVKLLDQAQFQASRLDRDANAMIGLIHSDSSWQSHAFALARVKAHVNDLAKVITDLQSSRVDASPWQKEAIDRLIPLLHEIAVHTSDEINWLNRNQDRPTSLKYDRWVNENATTAHELSGLISDTVRYTKDRGQLAKLSDQLDVNSTASR